MSRIAIFALVGAGQTPNEGHFRPIEVVTRPGSMFHPLPPAPCFLYAWPELVATEAINHALAEVLPDSIPAGSGADFCIVAWWGVRETGIPWGDGIVSKSGMGAHANGDGWTGQTVLLAGTSLPPVEVWESKNPWLFEKLEMAPDSCGPGKYQGGFGVDTKFHILEDSIMTNTTEHTQYHPWGLQGGGSARSNGTAIKLPDMDWQTIGKLSAYPVAKGTTFELRSGGGGGFGPSTERDPEKVKEDMRGGLISREFAEAHYPQALES